MMLRMGRAIVAAILAAAIGGCAARQARLLERRYASVVQNRVAASLDCSPSQIQVEPSPPSQWSAAGCGRRATFVCRDEPWLGYRCARVR